MVEWEDITSHHMGWTEDAKSLGTTKFLTVGWITYEDDKSITIFSTRECKGELKGHDTCIPKGCINKISKLRKY